AHAAELDGITGTPSAAYSTHKIVSGYTGYDMTVRRSSDNTTQDIGFDVSGNLDTTTLLSFVGSGSGYVTTWYDQSGNGNNAAQSDTSVQPRIVNAGVLDTEAGNPSLHFDGSND